MNHRKALHLAATVAAFVAGPVVLKAQFSGNSGYNGPQILSRSSRGVGVQRDAIAPFSIFGSVGVGYWDGLTGPVRGASGQLEEQRTRTIFAGGGISGVRQGRRDSLMGSYSGFYFNTLDVSRYGGVNQILNLGYQRQLSRRWSFLSEVSGGSQTTGFGRPRGEFGFVTFDESLRTTVSSLDIKTHNLGSMAGFAFQKSPRVTFSMSGGAFTIRRPDFVNVNGFVAQGEVSKVLSRRSAVGVVYSFGTYRFLGQFGKSFTNSIMAMYQRSLSPRWGLSFGVGPYRAESDRVAPFALDPFVASIIGESVGYQVFHRVNYGIGYTATLAGNFRRSGIAVTGYRGLGAGNDLLLTSRFDNGTVSYFYTASRRASFSAGANYFRLSPQLIGLASLTRFEAYTGNLGFALRIRDWLHFGVNGSFMKGGYNQDLLDRLRRGINFSLGASPSHLPVPGFR